MKFKIKSKSKEVMGDYIALHGLVPLNELPVKLRHRIPKDEIWIRKDIYDNKIKRNLTLIHEKTELDYMINRKLKYKKAHSIAKMTDACWC